MTTTGRKISKRACDGCKIRKIKCTYQSSPSLESATVPAGPQGAAEKCAGCTAVGIACTFLKRPNTRGPRKLRKNTIEEIHNAQKGVGMSVWGQTQVPLPGVGLLGGIGGEDQEPGVVSRIGGNERDEMVMSRGVRGTRIPTTSLVLQLCIYRLRLFAIWPILLVEEIIATLQHTPSDLSTYALATAIGAATIAQLKIGPENGGGDSVTAERMEEECQRVRRELAVMREKTGNSAGTMSTAAGERRNVDGLDLTALRTAFFLHVYHENMEPGGVKSLVFLREAITMAQMMGMHRESSYSCLPSEEQQLRRRILWLLFVTERGIAILHKLPIMIKPNIAFPSNDSSDEACIFPAFQKLVNLFWIFDRSGAFDILQDHDAEIYHAGSIEPSSQSRLDSLQKQLDDVPISGDSANDVQTADIAVTRQWMRAVVWKASTDHGPVSAAAHDKVTYCSHPFQIAKDFLGVVCRLPNAAIEAHGPSMEMKIYEIASSVTEAIASISHVSSRKSMNRPREILNQLHHILSSCRGGNKMLVSQLRTKIAKVQGAQPMLIGPSSRFVEEGDDAWDGDQDEEDEGVLGDNAQVRDVAGISQGTNYTPSTDGSVSLQQPIQPAHLNDLVAQQQQQYEDSDVLQWNLSLDQSAEMQFDALSGFEEQHLGFGSSNLDNLDVDDMMDPFLVGLEAEPWDGTPVGTGIPGNEAWGFARDGGFVI